MKDFPILHGEGMVVPYELVKQHEKQVMINHGGQTVERICERGGLDWVELFCVLNDMPFDNFIPPDVANNSVLNRVENFKKKSIVAFQNLRPCVVKLEKDKNRFEVDAYFHRWGYKSGIDEHSGGLVSCVTGIIEYEDGTIDECCPKDIKFTDR